MGEHFAEQLISGEQLALMFPRINLAVNVFYCRSLEVK